MSALDTLTRLRASSMAQHPEMRRDDAAVRHVRQLFDDYLAAGEDVRVAPTARAAVLLCRPDGRFGPEQRAFVELAIGDEDAQAWVIQQLRELATRFDDTLELKLDVVHEPLLEPLRGLGLADRLVILHGDPALALDRLRASGIPDLGELRIAELSTETQIDTLIGQRRAYFTRYPEYGFIAPGRRVTPELQARIDAFARQHMIESLAREVTTDFVVLRGDDEILGQGGCVLHEDHPVLGRGGGMNLFLEREIQGRGVSKALYATLLERMLSLGVEVMVGRSANPAVLHLAETMGRPLRGWQLEPARVTAC